MTFVWGTRSPADLVRDLMDASLVDVIRHKRCQRLIHLTNVDPQRIESPGVGFAKRIRRGFKRANLCVVIAEQAFEH